MSDYGSIDFESRRLLTYGRARKFDFLEFNTLPISIRGVISLGSVYTE